MTVRNILAKKGVEVTTIEPHRTVLDAIGTLAERRIGAVVVCDRDGALTGIVSERDIVRVLAERGAGVLDAPVAEVMTEKVETCTPGEAVHTIMERMTVGKFRHVPVLDGGRLAGIVSIGDIVKYRLDDVETESRALKEYILTA